MKTFYVRFFNEKRMKYTKKTKYEEDERMHSV